VKALLRALSYFRPDAGRIGVVLVLLLVSVGLNVLKPWPFALLVDNVLGKKPYPSWAPETVKTWNALTQITAIALALLAVSFLQAVHGELPFKQRLAVQTIRGSGFASGNSQGWRVEGLGRPLSPRACRRIALGVRAPRCRTF
jgi:ABC-type multidrug transport system fused ATPase/permease subunit